MLRFKMLVLSLILTLGVSNAQWISPCPSIFRYNTEKLTEDSWEGDITLKSQEELSGIWMRVVLDKPPKEVLSDFGEVVQRESQEYLVRKPSQKLSPGEEIKLKLTVHFEKGEPAPQLLGFRLNARVVCPENGILDSNVKIEAPPAVAVVSKPVHQQFISPCPNIFKYDPSQSPDVWSGQISLKSQQDLAGIWIRVIFSNPPSEVSSDFGEVVQRETQEYLIRSPGKELKIGETLSANITVHYDPNESVPHFLGFRLNARVVCPENGILDKNNPLPTAPEKPTIHLPEKPIENQTTSSPANNPGELEDEKIVVFKDKYYVVQKFPQFTLIHVKRKNKDSSTGLSDFGKFPFNFKK